MERENERKLQKELKKIKAKRKKTEFLEKYYERNPKVNEEEKVVDSWRLVRKI